MLDGWIKTAAATPRLRVADCVYNAEETIACMYRAAREGVRLLVFPELGLTGATCGDLFLQASLLQGARAALAAVQEAGRDLDMLTVVGLPLALDGRVYDCAAVVHAGIVLGFVPRRTPSPLARCLAPAPDGMRMIDWEGVQTPFARDLLFACRELPDFLLGVEVGEDLYAPVPASSSLAASGATLVAHPAAMQAALGADAYLRTQILAQSGRLALGYVHANAGIGESTTDGVFAGGSLVAENGAVLAEGAPYASDLTVTDIDTVRLMQERRRMPAFAAEACPRVAFSMEPVPVRLTRAIDPAPFIPADPAVRAARCEEILRIQAAGLARRIEHSHSPRAVIGISGGLDSCLAILVAARAMDILGRSRRDILAVTMPCFGTTARTRGNAEILSLALGAELRTVDVKAAVDLHFADIGHDPDVRDVTYENSQARERTQILMDLANEVNGLVVGTGDISELALGWATYNGDHMSMYGVNAALPKTLIRHIVAYEADRTENDELRTVLLDILATPVSPELLPANDGEIAQKTEDIVGPYELHDFFLYHALRWGFTPGKIYRMAQNAFSGVYDDEVILRWLRTFFRRFFIQQFKRSCLPDGPAVGKVTLSPRGGWQMPSDALSALWLAEIDALQ